MQEEIRKKTGYVVQRADGVFDIDANTAVEDLKEALEIKLPEVGYMCKDLETFGERYNRSSLHIFYYLLFTRISLKLHLTLCFLVWRCRT